MKILDVIKGERLTKEYKLSNELSIVLQTLTAKQYNDVERELAFSLPANSNFQKELTLSRIPILAKSLVSINGVSVNQLEEVLTLKKDNEKLSTEECLRNLLEKLDDQMLWILRGCYTKLEEDNAKQKESIKNFIEAQSQESTGSYEENLAKKK